MNTTAVIFERPQLIKVSEIELAAPTADDVIVEVKASGISTGTERLLWSGRMPPFPGMAYPLVPGYESFGEIVEAGSASGRKVGETVFVPGANCYGNIRGLFGGTASRVVIPGAKALTIDSALGEKATLIALAATAYHTISPAGAVLPDLIVGHGVLGRLLARIAILGGAEPVVWEKNLGRQAGAKDYMVLDPDADPRRDYRAIYDVSGDASLLDALIGRLATGGEIVLAGFYDQPLSFAFPPAFMKEVRLRVAAQWREADLHDVRALIELDRLSLDGLITHREPVSQAVEAYRIAFENPACLKMILNWSTVA